MLKTFWKNFKLITALLLSTYLLAPADGQTQIKPNLNWLKTGINTYQSTDGVSRVIIAQELPHPGIFIATGAEVALQNFHPAHLKSDETVSAFISFDPSTNTYSALFANNRQYKIVGPFTLLMQYKERTVRVTVDNNNTTPYISIVTGEPGGKDTEDNAAIIGIVGLSVALIQTGQTAVAVLEANQFSHFRKSGIIDYYALTSEGIQLKGKPVTLSTIGLGLEPPKNRCLADDAVLLEESELKTLRRTTDPAARVSEIERLLSLKRERTLAQDLLWLRIEDDDFAIGLDYRLGEVKTVRHLGGKACVVEKIDFDS